MAAPVELPKHNTLVTAVAVVKADAGWVMVTVLVVVQALASVTVTVFTPEVWPLITDVVWAPDHK